MLEKDENLRPDVDDFLDNLKNLFDSGVNISDRLYTLKQNISSLSLDEFYL